MTIEALRTPDARFANLPGFPWEPRYLEDLDGFDGLRLHYVDEGPADAPVFLCLHGEPTWAFLYRHMIPVFLDSGARVIAPDFFGFGRSDKPVDDADYTFGFHRRTLLRVIERLELSRITVVCQDWGGLLGLTLPLDVLIDRFVIMNTTVADGRVPSPGFEAWKLYSSTRPDLAVGKMMGRAVPHLSAAETAAYDAPFPHGMYKAGVRSFPEIVPVTPKMAGADVGIRARTYLSEEWDGACFTAVGMRDPVLGKPVMDDLVATIRGAPAPMVLEDAGHFVQEWGKEVAEGALRAFAAD